MLGVFTYLVEGPLSDPASINKPSTPPIPTNAYLGNIPFLTHTFGLDVHWGLVFGLIACVLAYVLLDHTTFGFAARMAGGNVRAAQAAGLPVGPLILVTCLLGGAAAGLAGVVEVAAVDSRPTPPCTPHCLASPASWSRSSPATIRWASFPWPSCSAA